MARELVYESSGSVPYMSVDRRVSWGAVFAGTIVTLAVLISLTMLGAGIGLVSAPAAEDGATLAKGLGIGAGIWWLLTALVSFYIGGWVSGRLTGHGRVSDSVIHGALCWSATSLMLIFMLTSVVGKTLGGVAGMFGNVLGTAGGMAGSAVAQREGGGSYDSPREAIQGLKQQARQTRDEVQRQVRQARGDDAPGGAAQARNEAAATAEKASMAAGVAGLFGFLTMMLEAMAAMVGARVGTRIVKITSIPEIRRRETVGV